MSDRARLTLKDRYRIRDYSLTVATSQLSQACAYAKTLCLLRIHDLRRTQRRTRVAVLRQPTLRCRRPTTSAVRSSHSTAPGNITLHRRDHREPFLNQAQNPRPRSPHIISILAEHGV